MAKQSTRVEVNNFVKGFITEASPLNVPPNATTDEQNFELRRNGTRDRRLGLDLENTSQVFDGDTLFFQDADEAPETFVWKAPGGDANKEFLVVSTSDTTYFFNLTLEFVSNDYLFAFTPSNMAKGDRSFASVDGKLVIAYGYKNVCILSYDTKTNTFTPSYESIKTRDVWGMPEEQASSYRPSALTPSHEYNLNNQSWGVTRRIEDGGSRPFGYPIGFFQGYYGLYPSNVDVVWTGMNFRPADPPVEAMVPSLYADRIDVFNPAAKGYFIIDALRRGETRYTAYTSNPLSTTNPNEFGLISNLTAFSANLQQNDNTDGGATLVQSYAGRVFFGGFTGITTNPIATTPDLSNFIFFSQLVRNEKDIVKCYQEGDPTSREGSDIVDTDGGFVRVSGLAKLVGMEVLGDNLIIFGTNGVWELKGGSDFGFGASNYAVRKISNFGCLSRNSIITEGSSIFFWSDSGILVLSPDQFNVLQISNLTQDTIQTFYENIESSSKQTAKGAYDSQTRKVKWIYDIEPDLSVASVSKELVFDLALQAFSKNVFGVSGVDSPRIVAIFNTPPFRSGTLVDEVVVLGDPVESEGVEVAVTTTVRQSGLESIKYVINYQVSESVFKKRGFAHLYDQQFKDWASIRTNGVDAKAFMLTGAVTGGDSSIHKQVPYLVMHFRRTEEGMEDVEGDVVPAKQSSCLVRSQWDWAGSANSNKWSPLFQAYRQNRMYMPASVTDPFDTGFDTIVTKSKLRGRGRAFALYMETEPEKDCRILGWNLSMNGNSVA